MRGTHKLVVIAVGILGLLATGLGITSGTGEQPQVRPILLKIHVVEGKPEALRELIGASIVWSAGKAFFVQIDSSKVAGLEGGNRGDISLLSAPRIAVNAGERIFMPGHESYQRSWIFGGKGVTHVMGKSRHVGLNYELIPTIWKNGFALACDVSIRSLLGKTNDYAPERVPNGVFTEAKEFMFTALVEKGATAMFYIPAEQGKNKAIAVLVTPSLVEVAGMDNQGGPVGT